MVRIRCCRDSGRCHGSSHKCCHRQPCDLWEPACRRLQPPLLPGLLSLPWQLPQVLPPLLPRLLSLPWQLPQVLTSAAMPSVGAGMMATAPSAAARAHVAAMAAPTSADIGSHSICGSRHAGDCSLRCCQGSCRCPGSSHKCCHRQPFNLWEPACRRLHPPLLPRLLSLPWQLPQVLPSLLARLMSLPWQLPQVLPSAAMPSVGAGMMATAPFRCCRGSCRCHGSSHKCCLRYCRDSCRCHGSSHKCCHRQPFTLWEPACRRLHPPLLPRLLSLPWQLPQVLTSLLARLLSLPWQLPQVLPRYCSDSGRCLGSCHKCCHRQPFNSARKT